MPCISVVFNEGSHFQEFSHNIDMLCGGQAKSCRTRMRHVLVSAVVIACSVATLAAKKHPSGRTKRSTENDLDIFVAVCLPFDMAVAQREAEIALLNNGFLNYQVKVLSEEYCSSYEIGKMSAPDHEINKKVAVITISSTSDHIFVIPSRNTSKSSQLMNLPSTGTTVHSDDLIVEIAAHLMDYFGWRTAVIVTSNEGDGAWKRLSDRLELTLRRRGFIVRHPSQSTGISSKNLQSQSKVVFACLPTDSEEWSDFLTALNDSRSTIPTVFTFADLVVVPLTQREEFSQFTFLTLYISDYSKHFDTVPSDSRHHANLLENLYRLVTLAGHMLNESRYERLSGEITYAETYEAPSENSMSIRLRQSSGERGQYSLRENGRNRFTLVRHIRPVLMQWLPKDSRFLNAFETEFHDNTFDNITIRQMKPIQWSNAHVPIPEHCDVITECQLLLTSGFEMNAWLKVIAALLSAVVAVCLIIFWLRWRLSKTLATKGANKILFTLEDIVLSTKSDLRNRGEIEKRSHTSASSFNSHNSQYLNNRIMAESRSPVGANIALYKGEMVYLRFLKVSGLDTFAIKNKTVRVIATLRSLRNENINTLYGFLCHGQRPAFMFEYCSRGSLFEINSRHDLSLDWTFKSSLINDLVRGMRYLHNSSIQYHGHLTSRNCVVDSRWVLKVTDFGLPLFYRAQDLESIRRTEARDFLWSAPELIRHDKNIDYQACDVYSFAIILQEIITREEPYGMLNMTPEEIVKKVAKCPPLTRPSVSKGTAPPEVMDVMKSCWAEVPCTRPEFQSIHDTLKRLNQGKKVNFIDMMFEKLEKYSDNLEDLIRERTQELDLQKKKTDQLLNRMLPSPVAEKLKMGLPVEPEQFEQVTIYFSDIVGFTSISAYSTPMEIINLLNDLYTCFDGTIGNYNVYKVETIGDAYMVVSGLPIRCSDHAEQIADMALDLLHESGTFVIRHLPEVPVHLRVGIHTGPCCAGVVGLTMPRFCLFGDTVNTASRMESTGAPWRIQISSTTHALLLAAGGYKLEFRGMTELKGKGEHPTYWLLGRDDFNKRLPTPPPIG